MKNKYAKVLLSVIMLSGAYINKTYAMQSYKQTKDSTTQPHKAVKFREGSTTKLHEAVKSRDRCTIKDLIDFFGYNLNDIDEEGRTPLHYAVIFYDKETIAFLLYNGADKYIKDLYRKTVFDYMETIKINHYHNIDEEIMFRMSNLDQKKYFSTE